MRASSPLEDLDLGAEDEKHRQREQELLDKRIGADSGRRAALQKAVADLQKALEEAGVFQAEDQGW